MFSHFSVSVALFARFLAPIKLSEGEVPSAFTINDISTTSRTARVMSVVDPALKANQLASQHGVDLSKLPKILNMSADSITDNVHAINSNCQPPARIRARNFHYE
ncbi:hypothetical protein DXG03_003965 [Asterophora parasitica]|uniref:Uncharacterized protein n=1 Tax=Asterophora parasitica TaxID=117018 RepID=A0A9P7G118_9AGAR|nr:hypothetical protein DXG03_003965 [Asterophora parasitica]